MEEEEIQNLQEQQQQLQIQEPTNTINQEEMMNKFTEILQEAQQAYLKKLQGFQQTIQQQQKQLLIKNKKLLELQNKRKCSCCFEKIGKEIAFVPCGHIAYCENCCLDQFGYQQKNFKEYDNKLEQMGQCPICNQTIFDAIKIYEPTQIFTID
ncbi:hypothetical protein PPERSA_08485 [Pseudocohnilembus persalinus]|uniref:RING-type domain-containing protein n=1 Tax=Pseudocohnilembus persalinus TaxID=266149 RepID=A0A0V0R6G6_PSEPJ|nr:hypothetical protein PPERSA_08485 [Pseudocohnilembus persalinus]|eukprot:KRX10082.1 hypothetical protein PPERSA_08485 [Pseudocohnilembus persalinus]